MTNPAAGALETTLLDTIPVVVPPQRRIILFLLLLLTVLLHVVTAGWGPIEDGEEGWTAAVARQLAMGQNADHISQSWGQNVQPDLATHLTAQSFRLLGINEFAARVPSVLAILAVVCLVYLIAERQGGVTRGLAAGVMAVMSSGPLLYGKMAGSGSLFACWMMLALYFLSRLLEQHTARKKWLLLLWISLTQALLTEGWRALLVPAASVILLLVFFRQARIRLNILSPLPGLLFIVLPALTLYFYLRAGGGFGCELPQVYSWKTVSGLFFPWALIILPPALFCLRRVLRTREMECNEALVWFWTAASLVWLLAELGTGTWPRNVALLWPALALVCAIIWERFNSGFRMIACTLLSIFGLVGLVFPDRMVNGNWLSFLQPIWWLSCGVMIVFGIVALVFVRQRHSRAALLALTAAVIPLAFNLMDAHARYASVHTLRELAAGIDLSVDDRKPIWVEEALPNAASLLFYAPTNLRVRSGWRTLPVRDSDYLICQHSREPFWTFSYPNSRIVRQAPDYTLLKISQ